MYILTLQPNISTSLSSFDDVRMEQISNDLVRLSELKRKLSISQLKPVQLTIFADVLNSFPNQPSSFMRLESHSVTQKQLMLRCEGLISGTIDAIKKFIDWVVDFIKGLFGSSKDSKAGKDYTPPSTTPQRTTEQREKAKTEKWMYGPRRLNNYFSYQTEQEAVQQFKKVASNVSEFDGISKFLDNFPFDDYLKEGTSLDFSQDYKEKFLGGFSKIGVDLDNVFAAPDAMDVVNGRTQAFAVAPKMVLVLWIDDEGKFKMLKLDTVDKKDCAELEVAPTLEGDYDTFGRALLVCRDSVNKFITNRYIKSERKAEKLEAVGKNLSANSSLDAKNAGLIARIYAEWAKFLKELYTLVSVMDESMDRLEGKEIKV